MEEQRSTADAIRDFNFELAGMGKVDLKDPVAVENRIAKFNLMCQEYRVRPVVASFALALGCSKEMLYKMANGMHHVASRDTIAQELRMINATLEGYVVSGTGNTIGQMFALKNSFAGYTDTFQYESTNERPQLTAEELIAKAKALPIADNPLLEEKVVEGDYKETKDETVHDDNTR